MELIKVDTKNPHPKVIKKAAEILERGGLIVYPTDTAYGLGANALNENAVRKVYEVKDREFSKPTHVIVRDWKMIENLTATNELARKLYKKFMPGPLTVILPKKKTVPDILTAGLPTLGVRIPKNNVTIQLSNHLTFPYTTPSANKSGGKTPYSIDKVKNQLDLSRLDLILDAGNLPEVLPSTIVGPTINPPKILREGPITKSHLEEVLGNVSFEV